MTDSNWIPYEHSHVRLDAPGAWESIEGVLGSIVAFREPGEDPMGYRANLNVVATDVSPESLEDQEEFFQLQLALLGEQLTDPLVLDVDVATLAGEPARRLLLTYREGIRDITLEQWYQLREGRSWVVSALVESVRYSAFADVFAHMVSTVEFEG